MHAAFRRPNLAIVADPPSESRNGAASPLEAIPDAPKLNCIASNVTPKPVPIYVPSAPTARTVKRLASVQQRQVALDLAEDQACSGLNFYDDAVRAPPLATREELVTDLGFTRDPVAIFGPGGWGKTKTANTLGVALSTGVDFIGRVGPWLPNGQPDRERVYEGRIWNCEDSPEQSRRTMQSAFAYLDTQLAAIKTISDFLTVCPRRGYDSVLMAPEHGRMKTTKVYDELKQELRFFPVDFLVIDHIGHAFAGNNDDRVHVTQFINALVGLQPLKEFALILLGHPSRGDDSQYGGSIAWDYGVRQRWFMGPSPPGSKIKPQEGVTYLSLEKANDRPKREPIRLQYRDGIFVPGPIVKDSTGAVVSRADQALQFTTNCICEYLQKGTRVLDSPRSPDYLPKVLSHAGALGEFSEQEIAIALETLKAKGRLTQHERGKNANRKTQFTLGLKL
jgi:RecA-family ATPase